ncbi:hypothetical protein GCM10023081_15020 [Arthrobacter ginkgonis]|uniref:DUF2269 domain-containing protein n=1 Tax=Arthrobacter ginkgonis TaxID=1630594 RepID=A0ABP7C641_9MICC
MNDSTATSPATRERQVRRPGLGRRSRLALLTTHIVVSVGLLGDSAGFLAVAIRRATSDNPAVVEASHELLGMFALFFGIPLSFLALITGAALSLGTRWGLFRYPWVIAKLALTVSVIVVGATVLRPVLVGGAQVDGGALIAGAAYDVVALTVATALGVFKPGKKLRRHRPATAAK